MGTHPLKLSQWAPLAIRGVDAQDSTEAANTTPVA